MRARPLVKRLDADWDEGQIVTLDVLNPLIRAFADEVGFEATPTFILFDVGGNEVGRWVGDVPKVEDLELP